MRLWREWCVIWPEEYGHESLQVKPQGFDPVFDLIPAQAYIDFYTEITRHHPKLRQVSAFEIMDAALNCGGAPEHQVAGTEELAEALRNRQQNDEKSLPLPEVSVELEKIETGFQPPQDGAAKNQPRRRVVMKSIPKGSVDPGQTEVA